MSVVFVEKNNYCLINDKIIVNIKDGILINKLKKLDENSFIFDSENKIWIYCNYKSKIPFINILYPDDKIKEIDFKNNNVNDYQRDNLIITYDEKYLDNFIVPDEYKIIEKGISYKITEGKFARQYRNMYWKVKDSDNMTYYLMHIKNNIYTKISKRDIDKILNFKNVRPVWYLNLNGYIGTTIRINNKIYNIYLHQLIMDVHDEDLTNFEKTVDHINRDKVDNRRQNLRLVNMSIQNSNRDKPERRKDACDLPDGLSQSDLPKYIVYRKEILNHDTDNYREYFYICNHPKLDKNWETTKSMKITIKEKLKLAKLKLQELNGDISEKQFKNEAGINKMDLPNGISLNKNNIPYNFVFDLRHDNSRYNLKSVLKSNNIQEELNNFIDLINKKYTDLKYEKYKIINPIKIKSTTISSSLPISEPIKLKSSLPISEPIKLKSTLPISEPIKLKSTLPISEPIKLKSTLPISDPISDSISEPISDSISEPISDFKNIKLILPPNFSFYYEQAGKIYYFSFNKTENGKRLTMKSKLKTNNIQDEFDDFINQLNEKYNLSINQYKIQNIDNLKLIDESKIKPETNKPIMPINFSICNVKGIDYIQFCKKIDNKKRQYKHKISSYNIKSELDKFINYLNDEYNFKLNPEEYPINNTNNWNTSNSIS